MASGLPPLPPDINQGPMMLRAVWIMTGIAAVIVILRLYVQLRIIRKVGLSDYLMILALLCGIIDSALITQSAKSGLGRHIFYLTPPEIMTAIKFSIIEEPFGIFCSTFGRISFALYMIPLVVRQDRIKCWGLYTCIWVTVVVNVAIFIMTLPQCRPYAKNWDPQIPGKCWPRSVQSKLGFFQGAVNTLVDLTLTIIPALIVWPLQMRIRLKLCLGLLLGLSIFAAVACIIKTVNIRVLGQSGDFSYDVVPFVIWYMVENNVVIVAASIPTIRPLFNSQKKVQATSAPYLKPFGGRSDDESSKGYSNQSDGRRTTLSGGGGSFDSTGGILMGTTIGSVTGREESKMEHMEV